MSKYVKYKGRVYKSVDDSEFDRHLDKQVKKALDEALNYAVAAHTQFKKVAQITGDHSFSNEIDKFYQLARQLYNKL